MKEKGTIDIDLHAARSSGGRVIWVEITVHKKKVIRDVEDLRTQFGEKVSLTWTLISNGIRTNLDNNDPRIEQSGFLLRIPEKEARTGVRAECTLSA